MAVFVGFSHIFLLGLLIFKGLTARRLYKSFGVNGLNVVAESGSLWRMPDEIENSLEVRFSIFTLASVLWIVILIDRTNLFGILSSCNICIIFCVPEIPGIIHAISQGKLLVINILIYT
jgi:hypothetical protein